jgi:hypothetical protein
MEERTHREMTAAFTTAAVINFSMGRPEEPVSPLDYMPSRRVTTKRETENKLQAEHDALIARLNDMAQAAGGATAWRMDL